MCGIKKDNNEIQTYSQHFLFLEPSRQSDWDNIVACHRGLTMVTTWSYQRSTMGEHKLQHVRFTQEAATLKHTVAQVRNLGYEPHHEKTNNVVF